MGGELEFAVHPTDALLVTFAGSYVEAEFDSTVPDTVNGGAISGIKDGNRIPSVPNWQLSAVATYTFPGLWQSKESYITASWQFVGDQITQSGDQVPGAGSFEHGLPYAGMTGNEVTNLDIELDPYHLFNLNTGLVYDSWEVMFYIKNITRRKPATLIRPGTRRPRPLGLSRRPTPHVRHTQPLLLLARETRRTSEEGPTIVGPSSIHPHHSPSVLPVSFLPVIPSEAPVLSLSKEGICFFPFRHPRKVLFLSCLFRHSCESRNPGFFFCIRNPLTPALSRQGRGSEDGSPIRLGIVNVHSFPSTGSGQALTE